MGDIVKYCYAPDCWDIFPDVPLGTDALCDGTCTKKRQCPILYQLTLYFLSPIDQNPK